MMKKNSLECISQFICKCEKKQWIIMLMTKKENKIMSNSKRKPVSTQSGGIKKASK